MTIPLLGEPRFATPIRHTVPDSVFVPEHIVRGPQQPVPSTETLFELAGPRERLFFNPARTRAGIVTCGGLCPGSERRDPVAVFRAALRVPASRR